MRENEEIDQDNNLDQDIELIINSEKDSKENDLFIGNNKRKHSSLFENEIDYQENNKNICNNYTFAFFFFIIESAISIGLFYTYYTYRFTKLYNYLFLSLFLILFFIYY